MRTQKKSKTLSPQVDSCSKPVGFWCKAGSQDTKHPERRFTMVAKKTAKKTAKKPAAKKTAAKKSAKKTAAKKS